MQTGLLHKLKVDFSMNSGLRTVKESETKNRIGATTQMTENTFFSRILTESIPLTFDWRNLTNITEVKSQGYCGASWAFSSAAFF